MLDLSKAATIDSPFVPYNPDSCRLMPRDVSDVYQLMRRGIKRWGGDWIKK